MKLWPSRELQGGHPVIEVRAVIDRGRSGPILARVRCLSNEARVTYDPKHAIDLNMHQVNDLQRAVRSAAGQLKTLPCPTCGRIPT